MTTKDKRSRLGYPRDLQEAKQEVREASTTFIALGAFQAAVLALAFAFLDAGDPDAARLRAPWNFLDSAFWVFGGLWLRRSPRRTVAVGMALFTLASAGMTVANQIGMAASGGSNVYLVPVMLVGGFYAVRGTFAYHAYSGQPGYRELTRWPSVALGGLLLAVVGVVAFGYSLPEEVILTGEEIPSDVVNFVGGQNLLYDGEEILYFYSAEGDYRVMGTVLATYGVFFYVYYEDEVLSGGYEFDDIVGLTTQIDWDYGHVLLQGIDGEELDLFLPPDAAQIALFADEIRARAPNLER